MRLSEILRKGVILTDLKARSIDTLVAELVDGLILGGSLSAEHRDDAIIALLKREAISTTALGGGVAIPHAKVPFVGDFVGAMGYSRAGIDFRASDSKPVTVVFLLLSPPDDPYGHLSMLGTLAQLIRRKTFAPTMGTMQPSEIVDYIAQAESEMFPSG